MNICILHIYLSLSEIISSLLIIPFSINLNMRSTGQFLYYNGSQWINQNISENNVSNLTSDLLSSEKQSIKIRLMVTFH